MTVTSPDQPRPIAEIEQSTEEATYPNKEINKLEAEVASNPVSPETGESDQTTHVYVGLEKLDELTRDEALLEGSAEHGNESARAKLAAKKTEREEWGKKLNIDIKDPSVDIKHAKSISSLLVRRAAGELQPARPGYTRMFRGEGPPDPPSPNDRYAGKWFSPNLDLAVSFPIGNLGDSRFLYIDVPSAEVENYHAQNMKEFFGASKGGEYLLPREIITQTKEFIRFLRADTSVDPWSTKQSS